MWPPASSRRGRREATSNALNKASIYFRPGKIIAASKHLGVGMAAFERTPDYVQNYGADARAHGRNRPRCRPEGEV